MHISNDNCENMKFIINSFLDKTTTTTNSLYTTTFVQSNSISSFICIELR